MYEEAEQDLLQLRELERRRAGSEKSFWCEEGRSAASCQIWLQTAVGTAEFCRKRSFPVSGWGWEKAGAAGIAAGSAAEKNPEPLEQQAPWKSCTVSSTATGKGQRTLTAREVEF